MLHFGDKGHASRYGAVNGRALHPASPSTTIRPTTAICDERGSYDAAASKQPYARTLEFMAKHVG